MKETMNQATVMEHRAHAISAIAAARFFAWRRMLKYEKGQK